MWSFGNAETLVSQRRVWIRLASISLLFLSAQVLAFQNKFHQNVTRRDGGDIFSNPDTHCKSDSCYSHEGKTIGGNEYHYLRCQCSCQYEYTFVVHNTKCEVNSALNSLLVKDLPGKDAAFRLPDLTTQKSCSQLLILPTLDITTVSSRTLCLLKTDITKCHVVKTGSQYLYNGVWYPIWPPGLKQDTFSIDETNTRSIFKVSVAKA